MHVPSTQWDILSFSFSSSGVFELSKRKTLGGSIPWLPRSPNLNPTDFLLWEHLKTRYTVPKQKIPMNWKNIETTTRKLNSMNPSLLVSEWRQLGTAYVEINKNGTLQTYHFLFIYLFFNKQTYLKLYNC